jgi:hypothetical protein
MMSGPMILTLGGQCKSGLPRGMVGHGSSKMTRTYCHWIKARQENLEAEVKKSWAQTGTLGTQSAETVKSLVKWAEIIREAGQVFPPPFSPCGEAG